MSRMSLLGDSRSLEWGVLITGGPRRQVTGGPMRYSAAGNGNWAHVFFL